METPSRHECIDRGGTVQYYGTAFVDAVLAPGRTVEVDGDLIATHVHCQRLIVRNGSLLCPSIIAAEVHAHIFGVWNLATALDLPPGWTADFLRPMRVLPTPADWASEFSIEHGAWWFLDPQIVKHTTAVEPFIKRALDRKSCGRARVLLFAAVEILAEHPEHLTPLGNQIIEKLAAHGAIPRDWRF